MDVAEKYTVSSEVYDKSELSRIKAKECVISHLCRHMNNSPKDGLFEIFLILPWMCRNNSHASKYCQSLQNSYISIVLSVSWARAFGIFLYCLKSLRRTGSSDQCSSKFLCHPFHIRVSPTTPYMCKLSSTQAGKKPLTSPIFVVFSKIFSKKFLEKISIFGPYIILSCYFSFKITSLK